MGISTFIITLLGALSSSITLKGEAKKNTFKIFRTHAIPKAVYQVLQKIIKKTAG